MKINIFKKKYLEILEELLQTWFIKTKSITLVIYPQKNSIRGNHYHKKTSQYNFVIDGIINYYFKTKKQKKIKVIKLKKGDLILTKPNEIHAFKTVSSKSIFMVFTVGIRGGKDYEKDTYRVESIVK